MHPSPAPHYLATSAVRTPTTHHLHPSCHPPTHTHPAAPPSPHIRQVAPPRPSSAPARPIPPPPHWMPPSNFQVDKTTCHERRERGGEKHGIRRGTGQGRADGAERGGTEEGGGGDDGGGGGRGRWRRGVRVVEVGETNKGARDGRERWRRGGRMGDRGRGAHGAGGGVLARRGRGQLRRGSMAEGREIAANGTVEGGWRWAGSVGARHAGVLRKRARFIEPISSRNLNAYRLRSSVVQ